MYKGISTSEVIKFVSKRDPDPANPTRWHIHGLDRFLMALIEDSTTEYKPVGEGKDATVMVQINQAKRELLIIKYGLGLIENFQDHETRQAVMIEAQPQQLAPNQVYPAMPDKALAQLPGGGLVRELAEAIIRLCSMTEEEVKN